MAPAKKTSSVKKSESTSDVSKVSSTRGRGKSQAKATSSVPSLKLSGEVKDKTTSQRGTKTTTGGRGTGGTKRPPLGRRSTFTPKSAYDTNPFDASTLNSSKGSSSGRVRRNTSLASGSGAGKPKVGARPRRRTTVSSGKGSGRPRARSGSKGGGGPPASLNPYSGKAPIFREPSTDFLSKFESDIAKASAADQPAFAAKQGKVGSGGGDGSLEELGDLMALAAEASSKANDTATPGPDSIPPLIPDNGAIQQRKDAEERERLAMIEAEKLKRQSVLNEMQLLAAEQGEESTSTLEPGKAKGTSTLVYGWGRFVKPFFSASSTVAAMKKAKKASTAAADDAGREDKGKKKAASKKGKGKGKSKGKGKKKGKNDKKGDKGNSASAKKSPDQLWDDAFAQPTQPVPTMLDPEWLNYENVVDVSMTQHSTLVVTDAGHVYAMGYYLDGVTDPATCPFLDRPTKLPTLGRKAVVKISHCKTHTLATTKGGSLLSWGNNEDGQLGHSDFRPKTTPRVVNGLANVTRVACTSNFSAVVTKDGSLYTTGSDSQGQLGFGRGKGKIASFKKVDSIKGKVTAVDCGEGHMACLTFSGELYTHGNGAWGALGHGCPEGIYIDGSKAHLAPLSKSGSQSGLGSSGSRKGNDKGWKQTQPRPKAIENLKRSSDSAARPTPSQEDVDAALDQAVSGADGDTAKGTTSQQQFGLDLEESIISELSSSSSNDDHLRLLSEEEQVARMANYKPTRVVIKREVTNDDGTTKTITEKIRRMACGSHHMLALGSNGHLYSWGLADSGQLGFEAEDMFVPEPQLVGSLAYHKAKDIAGVACGDAHSALWTKDGDFYIWGHNGEWLGLSQKVDMEVPVRHEYLREGVSTVFCGADASIALCKRNSIRTVPAVRTAAVLRSYLRPYTTSLRFFYDTYVDPLRDAAKLSMPILPRTQMLQLFRNFDEIVLHVNSARDDMDELLTEWGDRAENRAFIRWFFGDIIEIYKTYISGADHAHEEGLRKAWSHSFATFVHKKAHSNAEELELLMAVPLRIFLAFDKFFSELTDWMGEEEPAHLIRRSLKRGTMSRSNSQADVTNPEVGGDSVDSLPDNTAGSRPGSRGSQTNEQVLDKLTKSPSMDVLSAIDSVEKYKNEDIPPYTLVELRKAFSELRDVASHILNKLDDQEVERKQKTTKQAHPLIRKFIRPVLGLFGFQALQNDYKSYAYPISTVFAVCPLLIVIVASVVGDGAKQDAAYSLIGLFFAFAYLLLFKSIFHGRLDPELREISNPSTRVRRNIHNSTEALNLIIEFFQMTSFSINRSYPWNNAGGQMVFEYTTIPKNSDTFTALVVLLILSMGVWILIQKLFRKGEERFPRLYKMYSFVLPAFFTGPLYMIILGTAFTTVDCTFPEGEVASLDASPDVACWAGVHVFYALVGLFSFGLFFPIATLTPFHAHSEFLSPNRDIRYVPLYIMAVQLFKAFLTLLTIFFSSRPWVTMPVTLVVEIILLVSTIRVRPCCIEVVNYARSGLYAAVAWSSVCSALTLVIDDPDNLGPTIALFAGWTLIVAGTVVAKRFTSLKRAQIGAAEHVFDLHDVKTPKKVPPATDGFDSKTGA